MSVKLVTPIVVDTIIPDWLGIMSSTIVLTNYICFDTIHIIQITNKIICDNKLITQARKTNKL